MQHNRESGSGCRPDVLPPPVMGELAKLQDNIAPFDTSEARQVVEAELKCRISDVFSEFSEQPVAAASLAQVFTPLKHVLCSEKMPHIFTPISYQ